MCVFNAHLAAPERRERRSLKHIETYSIDTNYSYIFWCGTQEFSRSVHVQIFVLKIVRISFCTGSQSIVHFRFICSYIYFEFGGWWVKRTDSKSEDRAQTAWKWYGRVIERERWTIILRLHFGHSCPIAAPISLDRQNESSNQVSNIMTAQL